MTTTSPSKFQQATTQLNLCIESLVTCIDDMQAVQQDESYNIAERTICRDFEKSCRQALSSFNLKPNPARAGDVKDDTTFRGPFSAFDPED